MNLVGNIRVMSSPDLVSSSLNSFHLSSSDDYCKYHCQNSCEYNCQITCEYYCQYNSEHR